MQIETRDMLEEFWTFMIPILNTEGKTVISHIVDELEFEEEYFFNEILPKIGDDI